MAEIVAEVSGKEEFKGIYLSDGKKLCVGHSETDFEGVEDMMQDVSTDVEREFSRKHNERIVHEVIKEMEEPDRTIFILRFFYYETVKVIAETVHLKEDNVESRIRRGKKKLKAELLRRGVLNE